MFGKWAKMYHRKQFGPNLPLEGVGGGQCGEHMMLTMKVVWRTANVLTLSYTLHKGCCNWFLWCSTRWQMECPCSHKCTAPIFLPRLVLPTLMMYNSLQLHLPCTSDGSSACLPGVRKKKTAIDTDLEVCMLPHTCRLHFPPDDG